MDALSTFGPCTAKSMWLNQAQCSLFGPCQTGVMVSGSGSKIKASVVVMLHLCPVCDPVLFLWLLRLKSQIELIALSLANFHPLVLWHYPVVDSSLEESKLVGKEREKEATLKRLKRIHLHSRGAGINDALRRRFRIPKMREKS